jgi:hypothetical protein
MAAAMSKTTVAASGKHAKMLIDGSWVDSVSGKEIPVENPGNRQIIGSIPRGGAEDVDRSVKAASKAFPGWSRVIPRERGRMLQKIADAVEARVEELARIVAEETGNAIRTQARLRRLRVRSIFCATSVALPASSRARPFHWASTCSATHGASQSAWWVPSFPGMRR